MPRPDTQAKEYVRNRLLAALPSPELNRLLPCFTNVELSFKQILWERGTRIKHIYFPLEGVVSLVCPIEGKKAGVEVGVVGKEGMLGLPQFLGTEIAFFRYVIQIPGEALVMRVEDFHAKVRPETKLHRMMLRYTHAFIAELPQVITCISLHPVDQRLCRWLLSVHDRVEGNDFPLTHEFLAAMLGVRRATVSDAAKALRDDGLILYDRGHVTLCHRKRLEGASCCCYAKLRAALEQVFE